jgi:hypothetical protein
VTSIFSAANVCRMEFLRLRSAFHLVTCLFCLLPSLILCSRSTAQSPPVYPGVATAISAKIEQDAGDGVSLRTWSIIGPGPTYPTYESSGNTGGWNVVPQGNQLIVTPPSNAPLGSYAASYATNWTKDPDTGINNRAVS